MTTPQLIWRFAQNDVRLVLRDQMLATLLAAIVLMGVGVRFAIPIIDVSLADNGVLPNETTEFRFIETFPMFVAFIALWQSALLSGTVFGFLLLDEKEDRTLTAVRVMPFPIERYLGYRTAIPAVLAFCFAMTLPFVMGSRVNPLALLPIALTASLTAPIAALCFATFADNKVQGLAYTKFGGVAGLTILVGYFAPEPWQWLLGLFPPFLAAKSYWLLQKARPEWWYPLTVGIAVELAILNLLLRRFRTQDMI